MGRILEGGAVDTQQPISGDLKVSGTLPTKIVPAGYMGEFGNGLWNIFNIPGTYTFTVPSGVTSIRCRVVGAGGSGATGGGGGQATGGGGGGYAHGVFAVTPGTSYTVTVG